MNKICCFIFVILYFCTNNVVSSIGEIPFISLKVSKCCFFLEQTTEPGAYQKNGMIVFNDDTEEINRRASGIFPIMTKYPISSFKELIDLLLPAEKANALRSTYLLYTKMADLSGKRKLQNNLESGKTLISAVYNVISIYNLGEAYFKQNSFAELQKTMEGIITAYNEIDFPKVQTMQEKIKNLKTSVPVMKKMTTITSELERDFKKQVTAYLNTYSNVYLKKLKDYFRCLIREKTETAGFLKEMFLKEMYEPAADLSAADLKSLTKALEEQGLAAFDKAMAECSVFRAFSHTEDMMIFELLNNRIAFKREIPLLIFSLNDLCNKCREKFSYIIEKPLIPQNILYVSRIQLKQRKMEDPPRTTVDRIYSDATFTPETDYIPIKGIFQIRMPNNVLTDENTFVVKFSSTPSIELLKKE